MIDLLGKKIEITTKKGEKIIFHVEEVKKIGERIFVIGTKCIIEDEKFIVPKNVPKMSFTLN